MSAIPAYPLQWPDGWKRTPSHQRCSSAYKVDFIKARDELARELRLLGAINGTVVISSNIPTRRDGLPLASFRNPDDPGVAAYWSVRRVVQTRNTTEFQIQNRVIACDVWSSVRENVRAVGLAVQALRMLERTGASEILDRAFTGFTALPPAGESSVASSEAFLYLSRRGFEPLTAELIEARFRELVKQAHPDCGGSDEAFRELVAAKEAALKAIG